MNEEVVIVRDASRHYYVWVCDINGMTMMRPNGISLTDACGKWNFTSSKHDIFNMEVSSKVGYPMGRCKCCADKIRKTRLNPNNRKILTANSREEAMQMVELLNMGAERRSFE